MRSTKFHDFRKKVQVNFSINKHRYVIAKLVSPPKNLDQVFSIIRDEKAITVIAKEGTVLPSISEEQSFRRITFEVILPFNLTGFLSYVSTLLASKNIPLFDISAYSTDHLFVRESNLDTVVELLQKDGMYRLDVSS